MAAHVSLPTPGPRSTEDSVDEIYNDPFIEVDEWRDQPVRHRYVHGGFKGTDAKFSFYFPPEEQYEKRFFHNTYPMALTSDIGPFPIQFDVAMGDLGFTLDSGAYYVQTNNGGNDRAGGHPSLGGYRANAEAAKFSRKVAAQIYGEHRPYGYIFGGSGGSYQAMAAAENTSGVWDGFLPYVLGTPNSVPGQFTTRLQALRALRRNNAFPKVLDAINPGGSGDPYAGLDAQEKAALREATLSGFPLRGWWNHESLDSGYLAFNYYTVRNMDPSYVEDFWSKEGYAGTDPASGLAADRLSFETTVAEVIAGPQMRVRLAEVPAKPFADADLIVLSGEAQGASVILDTQSTNPVGFSVMSNLASLAQLKPGDRVRIDNSWALAMETYHRHSMPEEVELIGWNQFRDGQGKPIPPQRPLIVGPIITASVSGSVPCGKVTGKTLVLETLTDIDSLPWQADWYRKEVKRQLGEDFDDNFALIFIENAQHDNPLSERAHAHTVNFSGALQQALRDLARWVETGVKPLETSYRVEDSQVILPEGAEARRGIQPVVTLTANGAARTDVAAGRPVRLEIEAVMPPGSGKIVAVEWDFEGSGAYPEQPEIFAPAERVTFARQHSYAAPGTYYPVVRVTSQREGDAATPYCRIHNIARARVVVA